MMGKQSVQPITAVWPIHRKQLLEEVLTRSDHHGNVTRIWVIRGHIFVSLEEGRKLLTFDVKPPSVAQNYQFGNLGCLDLELQSVLLEILFSHKFNSILLVQRDGHVQVWRFLRRGYTWMKVAETDLCVGPASHVLSVCLHDNDSVIYWCEGEPNTSSLTDAEQLCQICKWNIHNDETFLATPVKLLENCPPCDVYPIARGVFMSLRKGSPLVSGVVLYPHTNSVDVHSQTNVFTYKSPKYRTLDFRDILLSSSASNAKTEKAEIPVLSCLSVPGQGCVICILQDGRVKCLSDKPSFKFVKNLQLDLNTEETDSVGSQFFIRQDFIGQLRQDCVRYHNVHTGEVIIQPLGSVCKSLCNLSSSLNHPVLWTDQGILSIQMPAISRSVPGNHRPDTQCYLSEMRQPKQGTTNRMELAEMVCKSYLQGSSPGREFLLDGKRFQNPALVITMLDQLREKESSPDMNGQRRVILQTYSQTNSYQHTKYNDNTGPYLCEYMRLEKKCDDLYNGKEHSLIRNTDTVEKEVLVLLNPQSSLPLTVRQSHLEYLALRHPETVLVTLLQQLDVESEDLSEEELMKWTNVLASETTISSSLGGGGSFPLFEIISRLLLQQKPDQLVKFVHIAQLIHDKNVGVSAFIRKRQTFYERALSCLLQPETSRDTESAVRAIAQLLLAVETKRNQIKALQLLVRYSQWDAAIQLLKQNADNSLSHQEMFYILLTSVASCGVLSSYCVPVLQLIPENTSLMSILSMIGSHGKRDQPITKPGDIFCIGPADIELGQVQQILLDLLSNENRIV